MRVTERSEATRREEDQLDLTGAALVMTQA